MTKFVKKYGTQATNHILSMNNEEMAELIRNIELKDGNREATIGAKLILTVALCIAKETLAATR